MNTFLSELPLNEISKISGTPPRDSIPFSGFPRQHPSDKTSLLLVYNPLESHPVILEFKLEDIQFVEETHQAVTESGEGILMVKLWIRKGAHAMILEPFEVNEEVKIAKKSQQVKERFLKNFSGLAARFS